MLSTIRKSLRTALREKGHDLLADATFFKMPVQIQDFQRIPTNCGHMSLLYQFKFMDQPYCVVLADSSGCSMPESGDWYTCVCRGDWMSKDSILVEVICWPEYRLESEKPNLQNLQNEEERS
ncbi:hypothetical protein HNQ53_001684 [Microbulbifer hydrolyticus]|uniref:Uncharacterized protein n=1 Tax=Microbulbifer hydrolyticus TaxID=48074 RepID=A0AA89TLT0_9GAMM|nr:hypothetical protein [Microbulbifer hydrolyticus]